MILKDQKLIAVRLPRGAGEQRIVLAYDDQRRLFGLKFLPIKEYSELHNAVFWCMESDLIDVKQNGTKTKKLLVQLPQGSGHKEVLLGYNGTDQTFLIKFVNSSNAELKQAIFVIRQQDLLDVKKFGFAGLTV